MKKNIPQMVAIFSFAQPRPLASCAFHNLSQIFSGGLEFFAIIVF